MPHQPFDLEQVYDNEINPLMAKIIEVCKRTKMPMICSFNYSHGIDPDTHQPDLYDPERDSFCTTSLDDGNGWKPDEIIEATVIIRGGASTRPKMVAMTITSR